MAKVGRPCTVCTHANAAQIDANLAAGVTIPDVATRFRISESAAYRHKARHLSASLLREARVTASTSAGDLVARLAEALDDLSAARSASLMAGNASGVVRAAAAEAQAISTLLDRLGVDDVETARQLAAGESLARAVGAVVHADPDRFGSPLIAELRRRGLTDEAEAVERIAEHCLAPGSVEARN